MDNSSKKLSTQRPCCPALRRLGLAGGLIAALGSCNPGVPAIARIPYGPLLDVQARLAVQQAEARPRNGRQGALRAGIADSLGRLGEAAENAPMDTPFVPMARWSVDAALSALSDLGETFRGSLAAAGPEAAAAAYLAARPAMTGFCNSWPNQFAAFVHAAFTEFPGGVREYENRHLGALLFALQYIPTPDRGSGTGDGRAALYYIYGREMGRGLIAEFAGNGPLLSDCSAILGLWMDAADPLSQSDLAQLFDFIGGVLRAAGNGAHPSGHDQLGGAFPKMALLPPNPRTP